MRLAVDALDQCRRRIQQTIHGHRGRKDDPLDRVRRTQPTGADLLTDEQIVQLADLFDTQSYGDAHVEVEATWGIYRRMNDAPCAAVRMLEKELMGKLLTGSLSAGVPAALAGLVTPRSDTEGARRRRARQLRPARPFSGPTEAINDRQARTPTRLALGFRDLTNYTARVLLRPADSVRDSALVCEEPVSLPSDDTHWPRGLSRCRQVPQGQSTRIAGADHRASVLEDERGEDLATPQLGALELGETGDISG